MPEISSFVSADRVRVGSRCSHIIEGIPGFDPRPLAHRPVSVDGHVFVAAGVGVFLVMDPTGFPFELLEDTGDA